MMYFFQPLPPSDTDFSNYRPFIKNEWFRKHFMKFVYVLQATLILISVALGVWIFSNIFVRIVVFVIVYVSHELLHILAVYDIALACVNDYSNDITAYGGWDCF